MQQNKAMPSDWIDSNIQTIPAIPSQDANTQIPQTTDLPLPMDQTPLLEKECSSSSSSDSRRLQFSNYCPEVIDLICRENGDGSKFLRSRTRSVDMEELSASLNKLLTRRSNDGQLPDIPDALDISTNQDNASVVADSVPTPRVSLTAVTPPEPVDSAASHSPSRFPALKIRIGRRLVHMVRDAFRRERRSPSRRQSGLKSTEN
ncbi:hypothetical protein B7463_g4299, partial [Scytalidium lignicola]